MGKLVYIGQGMVEQEELETLILMQNQIAAIQEMYDQRVADILDRLLSGATVEHGIHTARPDRSGGRCQVTRLILNGRPA